MPRTCTLCDTGFSPAGDGKCRPCSGTGDNGSGPGSCGARWGTGRCSNCQGNGLEPY